MAKKYEHGLDRSWWFGKDDKKKNRVADSSTPTAEEFNRLARMVEEEKTKSDGLRDTVEYLEGSIEKLQKTMHDFRTSHPDLWPEGDDQSEDEEANASLMPGSHEYFKWQARKFGRGMKPQETQSGNATSMAKWHDKQMRKIRQDMCSVPPPIDGQDSESE
jgi:hypothetical protein